MHLDIFSKRKIKIEFQTQQTTTLPHGTEIKIPGVGATPVAVSTTLPAAVVQLSQQGKQTCFSVNLNFVHFIDQTI